MTSPETPFGSEPDEIDQLLTACGRAALAEDVAEQGGWRERPDWVPILSSGGPPTRMLRPPPGARC